jgi:salicylate hydroxylase
MCRVVIIGAGVSGGVIARGLQAIAGIETIVVDQVSRYDHINAGNGLNIGPNALKALDAVMPAMADELRAVSLPWTRWRANLVSGEPLYEIPMSEVADRPGIRIRWADLYNVAREAVAEATHFEEALVSLNYGNADADRMSIDLEHTVTRERRSIADIDLLIACDGRYSRVRELCYGVPQAQQLQVANFRLLIDEQKFSGLEEMEEWDMEQWFNGPHRLLAYRLPKGSIYLSGTVPIATAGQMMADKRTAAEALQRAYIPAAGPTLDICKLLVAAADDQSHTLHWSRMQQIQTRFRDRGGRVLLVGDSAHAMVPTLGQGATQAIEDGCAFVALMAARADGGKVDVRDLTAAYETLRADRIEFIRKLSWSASTPLLAGADPVAAHREMNTPGYRAALRQLYMDPLQSGER